MHSSHNLPPVPFSSCISSFQGQQHQRTRIPPPPIPLLPPPIISSSSSILSSETPPPPTSNPDEKKEDTQIKLNSFPFQHQHTNRPKFLFCHNCGDISHNSNRCTLPIMSYGAIAFKNRPSDGRRVYLMICRRYSLGYLDFMRGRLPRIYLNHHHHRNNENNQEHIFPSPIVAMISQMTMNERNHLIAMARDPLNAAFIHKTYGPNRNNHYSQQQQQQQQGNVSNASDRVANWIQYVANEELQLNNQKQQPHLLERMVIAANKVNQWEEPEWGFPKGKRNTMESDWSCALREFSEETGMPAKAFQIVQPPESIPDTEPWPLESRCTSNYMGRAIRETFRGSNFKRYSHRYLLLTPPNHEIANLPITNFQTWEVSNMQWFTVEEACQHIRPYNLEKLIMIQRLDAALDDITNNT